MIATCHMHVFGVEKKSGTTPSTSFSPKTSTACLILTKRCAWVVSLFFARQGKFLAGIIAGTRAYVHPDFWYKMLAGFAWHVKSTEIPPSLPHSRTRSLSAPYTSNSSHPFFPSGSCQDVAI